MKYILLILALGSFSCARIINKPYVNIELVTNEPASIIVDFDTFETESNRAYLDLVRKRRPAKLTVFTDSLSKTIYLKSKFSLTFLLNILPPTYGFGMFGDMGGDKVYTYHRSIYVDMTDETPRYFIYAIPRKGEIYYNFSIPFMNSFLLQPDGEQGFHSNNEFFGFGGGLDFYYADDRFVNVFAAIAGNEDITRGANAREKDQSMMSTFISVSLNHRINRFSYGYGLSFGNNNFIAEKWFEAPNSTLLYSNDIIQSNSALGLVFPGYIQLDQTFHIGLIYRPTFIRFNVNNPFKYEHLLSVDLCWKLRVKR